MKKILLLLAALLLAAGSVSRADTSYLTIQGPFGDGGAIETYKWKVLYEPGSLLYSIDLLNAVLGQAIDTGTTYTDGFSSVYDLYRAGNATQGASYIDFSGAGTSLFTLSFTINSKTVAMDPTYDPGWNFYAAGGAYANGTWTYSADGLGTRALADGSFDGWVFGATFPEAPITDTAAAGDNNPAAGNFASATVVNTVPEPGSASLLVLGGIGLLLRRRRP